MKDPTQHDGPNEAEPKDDAHARREEAPRRGEGPGRGEPYARKSRPAGTPPPLFEWAIPEGIKRKLEQGLDTLTRGDRGKLREIVGEMRLPREVTNFILSQVDETKGAVLRLVGREFRDFLEKTNLADELSRMLTKLSFEVRTEVRFRPNEKAISVPEVNTKIEVHRDDDVDSAMASEPRPSQSPPGHSGAKTGQTDAEDPVSHSPSTPSRE